MTPATYTTPAPTALTCYGTPAGEVHIKPTSQFATGDPTSLLHEPSNPHHNTAQHAIAIRQTMQATVNQLHLRADSNAYTQPIASTMQHNIF